MCVGTVCPRRPVLHRRSSVISGRCRGFSCRGLESADRSRPEARSADVATSAYGPGKGPALCRRERGRPSRSGRSKVLREHAGPKPLPLRARRKTVRMAAEPRPGTPSWNAVPGADGGPAATLPWRDERPTCSDTHRNPFALVDDNHIDVTSPEQWRLGVGNLREGRPSPAAVRMAAAGAGGRCPDGAARPGAAARPGRFGPH